MPIGDILAGARQRAGLTVAQVSEQTCIRQAVIEGIEGDDYSACGGDFYARATRTRAAAAPAPAAAAPAQTLTPASAGAPGTGSGNPTTRPQRDQRTSSGRASSPAGAPPPAPERILRPAPAPGPAPPSHDRGCPDHHRQRAPAVQRAASGSCQYLPGRHYDLRPETMERM